MNFLRLHENIGCKLRGASSGKQKDVKVSKRKPETLLSCEGQAGVIGPRVRLVSTNAHLASNVTTENTHGVIPW
jgi:hypothetical protein